MSHSEDLAEPIYISPGSGKDGIKLHLFAVTRDARRLDAGSGDRSTERKLSSMSASGRQEATAPPILQSTGESIRFEAVKHKSREVILHVDGGYFRRSGLLLIGVRRFARRPRPTRPSGIGYVAPRVVKTGTEQKSLPASSPGKSKRPSLFT